MKMQSNMRSSHSFAQVPRAEIPRSTFNRSHGHKTTFDEGFLVPIFVDEALPGDTFNLNMTGFSRLATPVFPLMDNMFMETQFFAVPMRLVWSNWQKFNGEQINPGDSIDFLIPQMVAPATVGHAVGSLSDYFGIPTGIADLTHSSLWHRAYNLIYNTWYRDENLQNSLVVDLDDGPDLSTDYVLQRRGKRHDYFTSSLPWPQKGSTGVSIPLGTSAKVITGVEHTTGGSTYSSVFRRTNGSLPSDKLMGLSATGSTFESTTAGSVGGVVYPSNLYADLSTATAATINQLRQSFQIQKLLERDARGGSRYTEIVRSHFGVSSPDARLQRPEFLGGGSSPINISPIAKTSSTDATSPQANLAAFGTSVLHNHGFNKSFTEHCLIIGIVSVRADLSYQQGLNRMFSRRTRYDYYWPALSHIGEQTVLRKEIYATGIDTVAADLAVFGYQERYAEYRYKPSQITGLFRSSAAGSLDSWHLSQSFSSAPTLSAAFIVEDAPLDRAIAVPSEPHFLFDSFFDFKCARPMPVYGVPGLIDHF